MTTNKTRRTQTAAETSAHKAEQGIAHALRGVSDLSFSGATKLFAFVVSYVASPPVLTSLGALLIGGIAGGRRAWYWALLHVALAVATPMAFVLWLVATGAVQSIEVPERDQRIAPMVLSVFCSGLGLLAFVVYRGPALASAYAAAVWLQSVATLGVTLRWKVSVHSTTASAFGVVAWALLGTPLALVAAWPLVAWSRVRLGHHTWAQVIVGGLLGFAIFMPFFVISAVVPDPRTSLFLGIG